MRTWFTSNRRRLFTATAATAAVLATTGSRPASARPIDQVVQTKRLRIGVNPTLPPLARINDRNQLEGFDIDVGNELVRILGEGAQVEFVQLGSPDRIPFVSTGRVDLVMGAMTRTPARALVIDYTVPISTQAMMVLTVDGRGIGALADLDKPSTQFIMVRGTIGVPWIQANAPQARVTLLDNYPDAIRALAQGRGNAMVDVPDGLRVHMANHNVPWKVLPDILAAFYPCIGVQKGNFTLRDWTNVALFDMHASGFIARAWEKWYGGPMARAVPFTPYF
jgi:polar amino acid transport system substrate-binding protein